MEWKRLLLALCVFTSVCANAQSVRGGLTVDESRSRIHLGDDAVTPILAVENSGSETRALVRVELVDPADTVRATGELEARLRRGPNQITVPLHGWTQKSDEWNNSVWYRVRYRVIPSQREVAGAEGTLALVARADGVFDLRVVTSKRAVPGIPLRVRIYTRSLSTLLPMAGVQLSAQLESDREDAILKLTSVTNRRGYAQLDFKVPPAAWGGSASLKVVARKGQMVREESDTVDFVGHWRFLTSTDKPLYRPGQVMHIRTLLEDGTRHALAKAPVTFTIKDEEETLAFRATAETSRFGVARADWEIPENLRLGQYFVQVSGGTDDTEDESGGQVVRISRYELPSFTVNVAPDHGYYLPGQIAKVGVSADYLFGKPVTKGHVKVAHQTEHRWNYKEQRWDVEEEQKWEGDTDTAGKFVASIDLSTDEEGLQNSHGRFRDLEYAAYFTDPSTGKTEQRRFRLRISRDPIHLYVIEAGDFAVGELPLEFYVSASYADGSPAQCEVAIYMGSPDDDTPGALLRSVRTNRYGVAKVTALNLPPLPPLKKQRTPSARLVLEAHDHNGRRGRETQDFWEADDRLTIRVMTSHALYRPDEPVEVNLSTNRKDASLLLDVMREGRVLQSQPTHVRNGHAYVVLPYLPEFQGELTIAAYAPLESTNTYDTPMGSRTVLYPHDPALKVTAKFDRATYHPGDNAVLNLHVSSGSGSPVEAALGSVIFDQAVEERARTDAEFGGTGGYGFDNSFRGYWYEPAELGGLKRQDLDRLDVSQPFGEDLQLASEVLLLNRWGAISPLVFGGANYPEGVGSAFHELLHREVSPVMAALDNAYEKGMSYPHDDTSLRRVLSEHGVNFDNLRDPWGVPFRAQFSFRQSFAVVDLISSGPDKKAGTEDDVTALSVSRRYFRPTAETIRKTMADYHTHTGGYIRDAATLKAELAEQGVEWDALRDPWGKPYALQFGISNTRYTLTVMSGGPDGAFESTPTSDDFPVWTESSDYFSEIAAKIDAALARHFAATQKFPENQSEFYQVLDEAQIPRSAVVDAWGHPAWPAFDSQAKFVDRTVMEYSYSQERPTGTAQTREDIQPETAHFAFIHLYSSGQDEIPNNPDDFELAVFSREIARQNSIMLEPAATPAAIPLSGGSGAITGVVTDPTGAAVAKVKVTAQLYDRVPFETVTDSDGRYTLRNLPTGLYTVIGESVGFRSAVVNHVPVKSLGTTQVNLRLQVGQATETVEVMAEAASLQTESSEMSSVSRPSSRTEAGSPIATPRLREFFPETLLWEPMLETDRQGNSRLRFQFADSITNWKLSLVASTVDGQVGLLDSGIKTFQPFFVEHDPPAVLTQGDEIELPVVLRNYLEKSQALRVEMKAEPWFKLLTPAARETSVAAGESERAMFQFRVTGAIGEVKQRVTAANRETGDAVEKPLRLHPDGEPRTVTSSKLFTEQGELDIDIPDYALPGSVQAELKLYPNLMAHVLESSRSLLERPYGCGEQTVSSTYPNVMLLRLYKRAGKPEDAAYRTALRFARLGYARLLSYRHDDGGISVWTQDQPDLVLTAYALHFLTDASEFIDVDPNVVESAQQWLLRRQTANGSWLDGSRVESTSLTAYVTLGLGQSRQSNSEKASNRAAAIPIELSLAHAIDYLRSRWSASNDPYAIAQVALAAFQSGDKALVAQANAKLRTMVHREGDSSYWALESNTLFSGWGTPGRVETTALASQALTLGAADTEGKTYSEDRALADQGLFFLISQKDGYGAWYSGQTTINVLEALLLLARPPMATENGALTAEITVNGEKAVSVKLPGPYEIAAPVQIDLRKFVKPGSNHVLVSRAARPQTASVQVVARYYIPWDRSAAMGESGIRTGASDALALRVRYDHAQIQRDQEIHCQVHAERIGFRGYGMLLAEIGLPPGAVVDRGSLEVAMKTNGWQISQYELLPDRLVVYLWSKAGGTDFDFTFRPRYGMNALTAPSVLYDYYNPEAQVVVQPTRIEVQ